MRNALSKTSLLTFAAALSSLTALAAPNPDQPVPERLDLKGAITFALENNFDIRQAEERIKQQEGILVEVRARNIPNADVSYYYSKFDKQRLEPQQRSTARHGLRSGATCRVEVPADHSLDTSTLTRCHSAPSK